MVIKMKHNKTGKLAPALVICVLLSLICTPSLSTIRNSITEPPIRASDPSDPITGGTIVPKMFWESNGTGIANTTQAEGGNLDSVTMMNDGQGGCFIAWTYNDPVTGTDIFAQHMDVFGNALWGGNGTPICRAHSDQQSPKIVSDGNGGIIVAWVEDRLSMMNPDIYAQRISAEGDTLWEDNGTIIANADYDQNYIKMVSDNHGGAIIVWEDGRGSDGDIYAQRVNGNGVCLWTANGTLISLVDDEDYYPNVFVNQKDDIFVAWDKYDDDYYYVSAQKMNLNGACQWDLGGVKVKQTEVYAIEDIPPLIIDDMAGGIILGWGEYDWDESDYFNYVNHISATGVRLWGSQGVLLSPDGDYETFDIISDGSGGLFATYDFEGDQYVQHIAATGFDDWETHVQISSGGSVAWHSPIVSDLNGGVIIAWSQNVEGVGSRRIFEIGRAHV